MSVFVSLLTTMSMIRIWQYSFWGKYPGVPGHCAAAVPRSPLQEILIPTGVLMR
ncbi:MAG: hypothetical protein R2854_31270 [Caldilineaceae bacterium]